MTEGLVTLVAPVSEKALRDLSKDPSRVLLDLAENDRDQSIKQLHSVIDPILETAEAPDLSLSHRAAAFNTLSAVIDKTQACGVKHVQDALLDASIWTRSFDIYLSRSENTKGKSNRQLLLTLTGVIVKSQSPRAEDLRNYALSVLVDVIKRRRDRIQVKPALQGLAHLLQKDVASIADLIPLYQADNAPDGEHGKSSARVVQDVLRSILAWVVHHDTALSAGHVVKNFIGSLRRSKDQKLATDLAVTPIWIEPVMETLHSWQDRIQEFKTHVFPHCFLPDTEDYLRFLSYLHFSQHVQTTFQLPASLTAYNERKIGLDTTEEFTMLLSALQSGKELGILKDVDEKQQAEVGLHDNVLHVPDVLFDAWLSDPNPDVRLAGLDIAVFSTAVTRPFTTGVLNSLRANLGHLHTEMDANFRKEVLNNIQRLLDRLRGSTAAVTKAKGNKRVEEQNRIPIAKECSGSRRLSLASDYPLAEPFQFILWYLHFIESELRSTASYQRRITALRALTIILKSGLDPGVPQQYLSKSAQGQLRWAHELHITTPQLLRSLFDLVLDPFDDIRSASVSVLEICLESVPKEKKATTLRAIPQVTKRAEKMMLQTGRADQADGVARLWSLLFIQCTEDLPEVLKTDSMGIWTKTGILNYLTTQLEETIEVARQDLAAAVDGRPVHGTFAALRYILDQESFYGGMKHLPRVDFLVWKGIHDRIRRSFDSLWSCVQEVLCVDAPEGHVPEEFDEEASLDTKEILSYSWRGLKEASVLLRTMVSKAPIGNGDESLLTPADVEELGKLCFKQLVELRHRGAHSTVAQTFATFCRRCMIAEDVQLRALPEKGYEETLLCIQDKATAITRRSAGIPSLMTGIITAESQSDGALFKRAIKDLFAEASQNAESTNIAESRLPQVHALNSIKEIFITSKLSEASEAYIGDGLDLAARTLKSSIWPIRNCGLMLFKALIGRLLGSDETQDWKERNRTKVSRFSYEKYPHLIGILKNLLDPEGPLQNSMDSTTGNSPMDLHGAEGVFPALQILRQAPPLDEHRDIITEFVLHLLGSPHWHLRDMAAKTIVSLHRPDEYIGAINMLLELLEGSHNNQHGVLLSLKYVLRQYLRSYQHSTADELNAIITTLKDRASELGGKTSCPFTKAAFIDLFNVCDLAILQQQPPLKPSSYAWSRLPSVLQLKFEPAGERRTSDALLRRATNTCVLLDALVPQHGSSMQNDDFSDEDENLGENMENNDDDDDDEDDDEDMDFGELMAGMGSQASMEDIMAKLAEHGEMDEGEEDEPVIAPVEAESTDIRTFLADLAAHDPDTCRDVLSTLGGIIRHNTCAPLAVTKAQLLSYIHEIILQQHDPEVVAECQSILAESLDDEELNDEFFEYLGKTEILETIGKLQAQCLEGPPSNMQSGLHLMGYFLDFFFCSYPKSRSDIVPHVERYIRLLSMTIVDTNPFDARFAAVQSMSALKGIWYSKHDSSTTSDLIHGLAFVLYDMLNDDDDDIRDAAAAVTSQLLRGQGLLKNEKDATPMMTVQRLAQYFSSTAHGRQTICVKAFSRLAVSSPTGKAFAQPFAETLAEARKEDTALFVQEKQNLYIDDASNVLFWAGILQSIEASNAPDSYISNLTYWVLDGLHHLTETAKNEVDGPLGWTNKAEVFTLGIKVISGAAIALAWKVPDASKIKLALRQFADVGIENELNGLWLEQIEACLEGTSQ